jgi:selenocysteine lyase/cysteine desulfurase
MSYDLPCDFITLAKSISQQNHHKMTVSNHLLSGLEEYVYSALETYSNVHRGSGHHSEVTTRRYEEAREMVLNYMEKKLSPGRVDEPEQFQKKKYTVIFCSPRRAKKLTGLLQPGSYHVITSGEAGIPLGVTAVVARRKTLPRDITFETGGGTAKLIAPGWVIWDKAPGLFEAGTPAIINVIAFVRVLQLKNQPGTGPAIDFGEQAGLMAGEVLRSDETASLRGKELLEYLRDTMVGKGSLAPVRDGMKPYINFDNAASTHAFRPVWEAVRKAWRLPDAQRPALMEAVRQVCASAVGISTEKSEVIFTSNTTEAINLVAESMALEKVNGHEPVIMTSLLEHSSNDLPWRTVAGHSVIHLPFDKEGFFDLDELDSILGEYNQKGLHGPKRITLVALTGASNVTGTFNDVAEISRIVHRYGAKLLVDAAQLIARRKTEMDAWGIDYLVFSAHKAYAPFGTGVLIARRGLLRFSPVEMEEIHSSGEANVGGIAALGMSMALLQQVGFELIREEEQTLTAKLLKGVSEIKKVKVFGISDPASTRFDRKGGVVLLDFKGKLPGRFARELASRGGIGVRYGCHCAHLAIKRLAGVPPWAEGLQGFMVRAIPGFSPPGIVRVSLGLGTTAGDVDRLIETLRGMERGK